MWVAPDWTRVIPPEYFREEPKLNDWQQQVIEDYSCLLGDATMNGTIPFMAAYHYYKEIYGLHLNEIKARVQCFRALEQADREYQDEKKQREERVKTMMGTQFDPEKSWAGV